MADIKNHTSLATSLQSYWDLEEADGTRYDLHGSSDFTQNGTGGVDQETGKVGNAATFATGDSDFLSGSGVDISGTTDKSVAFWIKIGTAPSSGTTYALFTDYQNVGNNRAWAMTYRNNGGTLQFYTITSDNGTATATGTLNQTLTAGTWYHVAFLYDKSAGSIQIYVNGSSAGTISSQKTTIYNGSDPFRIGALGDGGGTAWYLDGAVDEFGVWDKLLTSSEITDLYNSGSGIAYYEPADVKNDTTLATSLSGYWELEESTASSTWTDSHGTNNLSNNSSGSGVTSATGKQGNAGDFEFSNSEYLSISHASSSGLDGMNELSFSAWFKAEALTATYPMIAGIFDDSSSERGWCMTILSSKPRLYVSDNGGNTGGSDLQSVDSGVTVSTGTWYHVVGTFQGTNAGGSGDLNIYVNGVFQGNATSTLTSVNDSTADYRIGHVTQFASGTNHYFDGVIDEVAVWSKELTIGEIRALYGYGTPPVYEGAASSASSSPSASVSSSPSPSVSSSPSPSESASPSSSPSPSESASVSASPSSSPSSSVSASPSASESASPSPGSPSESSSPSPSPSSSVSSSPSPSVSSSPSTSPSSSPSPSVSSSPSPSESASPSSSPSASVSSSPSTSPSASPSPQVWTPVSMTQATPTWTPINRSSY